MIARGGEVARNASHPPDELPQFQELDMTGLKSIVDYQLADVLANGGFSIVALGKIGSEAMEISPQLFRLPNLAADFYRVFPNVDLVVHHGGSGTTTAALQSGTPQLIIPNPGDTSDQLEHGARIALIGCGKFIRPLPRIDGDVVGTFLGAVKEALSLVIELLGDQMGLKERCSKWKERIETGTAVDGVPVAVDTAGRLVVAAMLAEQS